MNGNREAGAVSIYFITATAAFVLLTALLIDFSRIAAFRHQTELAVQSGVRSVLSSFDPDMYDRYGLFIRGGEDAEQVFRTAAEGDEGSSNSGAYFPYLAAEWTGVDVTESRPLADHEVLRRQVLEEMKYKAPIDLTLEIADRFRGVSPALQEAASTVNMLEKVRQAYDRREAALDEVLESQHQAGGRTVSFLQQDIDNAVQIAADVEDADAFEAAASELASSLQASAGKARTALNEAYSEGVRALDRSRQANDEMRAITVQAANHPSSSTNTEFPSGSGEQMDSAKVDSISELRRTAAQLLLEDDFFVNYAAELDAERMKGLQFCDEADRFSGFIRSVASTEGAGGAIHGGAVRLRSMWSEYDRAYGGSGSVLRERSALLEAHRSGDQERKILERQAQAEWTKTTGMFAALSGPSGSPEDREIFEKASELSRENLEWNRTEDERSESAMPGAASEGRDHAMSSADAWMEALQGSLSGLRDELYFSEYTVQRFSYFPPSELKRMLGGEQVPLSLQKQETEFILYGISNPTGNIAAAYGEILSIRLAIRTMEGLIECRSLGHPLVLLAAALVYGIRNAMLDMNRLLEHDSVPLSKYVQVNTAYTDYLRLFLLVHGGSPGHLARSVAVMEQASGISFAKAYTYVSGEGTASLRLWFFPGLLKVMGRAGRLGGTIKGNRYEAVYTADSSYQ
ncbi:hypothetical protein E5161_14505 [Cohnella pontilimi]|uniref:Uncharacterized protein n=1 Tax=Cohnella pontilimi TaxID=2564100 RepID=A0A4U0F9Y1_9BACL|nr:hypothetical protein [Cohnella pontilimi]TJY40924.1 hypothetical protein E5161_14505 [Cohnella pontilimi]